MKKLIILFVALVFSFSASAQFKGGLFAGINGTQVDGDTYAGYYKVGLNISGAVFFPVSKTLAPSLEIGFTQLGSAAKPLPAGSGYPIQMLFRLNYIQLPILLNYQNKDIKGITHLTLTGGLSINKLLSDTLIHADAYNGSLYPGYTIPDIRIIHGFDFEGVLGFSYDITSKWVFNFRFNYSLAQFGASANSMAINRGLFNNVLSFRIGYIIGGKAQSK